MHFDENNNIVKLCAQGMGLEGEGKNAEALELFRQAWNESITDFERFTAAHYVARHQKDVAGKLKWDETALNLALKINDHTVKGAYPSLYLNVGKCHEDLHDPENAAKQYTLGLSFIDNLPDDGYRNLVRNGLMNGLKRVTGEDHVI